VGSIRNKHKSKLALNVKVVEKWIDEFLLEAEANRLNSTKVLSEGKTALERINFSRSELKAMNLSSDKIDRIYKTLFI